MNSISIRGLNRFGYATIALMLFGLQSQAAVIQFAFEGTVTNRFNNGLPDPSDIFGLSINVGDSVSGSFSIDTDASVFGSVVGPISGAGTGYTQSSPQEIRVNLGGGVFTSNGDFVSTVLNDYQDNALFPVSEQFTVNDGVSSGTTNITGDTIFLNESLETARLSLDFIDNDATAFDSTDLPTSLDRGDFEIAEGTISGTRPSGQANPFFYQATFRIDSIGAVAIPEPSCFALLAGVAGISFCTHRRRRS